MISASHSSSVSTISSYPSDWSSGANGCTLAKPGNVTGIISAVALSFIVHEPSGIMLWTSDRSRFSSFLR